MSLLDFLFGKKPKINFSKDGKTSHDLGDKKWQDWKDRFEKNPDYNYKNHVGNSGGHKVTPKK